MNLTHASLVNLCNYLLEIFIDMFRALIGNIWNMPCHFLSMNTRTLDEHIEKTHQEPLTNVSLVNS